LTTDPAFPVEALIAPLAFELKRLGVFHPCWSCEGHNDHSGDLWKVPRVWFYCDSVVHVRLLSDVVKELEIGEQLSGPWQVRLTFSDLDNPATAFSLEPEISPGAVPSLESLQEDVKVLTQCMAPQFARRAWILSEAVGDPSPRPAPGS